MDNDELKVTQTFFIPATIDHVWNFITSDQQMKLWFQANKFFINPFDGGMIEIPISIEGEEYTVIGEIGLVYPKSRLIFSWNERNSQGGEWFHNTFVEINLTEIDDETQFELVHSGFKRLPSKIREQIYQRYLDYWEKGDILDRLLSLIEAAN